MRHNRIEIYIHFIWSTWDRKQLILPPIERDLHRCTEAEAKEFGCEVLALDGMEDHVHVLLQMPATITVAEVAKHMKGNSWLMANERLGLDFQFRWSGAYAAFSVSRWDKAKLVSYIGNQKEHHANGTWKTALEFPPDHELIPDS